MKTLLQITTITNASSYNSC